MKAALPAILYALLVWWLTTGLVFLLVLRRRGTVRAGLIGAAALFPVCLYLLAKSSMQTSVLGAYVAFTAAILLWGTQEVAFLGGFLTGPRPLPCPLGAVGLRRVGYALGAILYHEIALIISGLATAAVTWQAPNQLGALTFLVLWVMRVSAKLNLFLGVPVLNDEVMPAELAYLRSYFVRGPANGLFPVTLLTGILLAGGFVVAAIDPDASRASEVGYVLLAALAVLAVIEHLFMLVHLPVERLWRWSTQTRSDLPVVVEARGDPARGDADIAGVLPTRP